MMLEYFMGGLQRILLKYGSIYVIMNGMGINKIMMYLLQFNGGRLCNANGHFFKTLPGVGRNDGGIKMAGYFNSYGCFAHGGGAGYNNTCFFVHTICSSLYRTQDKSKVYSF